MRKCCFNISNSVPENPGAHFARLEDQFVKSVSIVARSGDGEVGAERYEHMCGI